MAPNMIPEWSDHLLARGAHWNEGRVAHFGDATAELASAAAGSAVAADLSHFGVLALQGEEAQTFLHNQVTVDLRNLPATQAAFGAYCTAKGRMLANFLIARHGEDWLLLLPAALCEPVRKRLSMFILRAKVRLRDATDEWVRLGVSGPGSQERIAALLGTAVTEAPLAVGKNESILAIRLGPDRLDLLVRPDHAARVWETLAQGARPVGAPVWDWLLVAGGIPVILPQTQDLFVPQMANMEILGGVAFNKGCYPGQEVVARIQYLGKVKRRMFLAHVAAEARPGMAVYSPEPADQAAGHVANAAPAPGGGSDVLVVALMPSVAAGEVRLEARDGPRLTFRPLPYPAT